MTTALARALQQLLDKVQRAWEVPDEWTCMVCGDYRPDEKVTVAYRISPDQPPQWWLDSHALGPQTMNVRHCNDRSSCIAYATADGPWQYPDRTTA